MWFFSGDGGGLTPNIVHGAKDKLSGHWLPWEGSWVLFRVSRLLPANEWMGFLALRQFSVRVPSVHVPSVSQCPLEEITVRLRGPRSRQQQLQKEVIAAGWSAPCIWSYTGNSARFLMRQAPLPLEIRQMVPHDKFTIKWDLVAQTLSTMCTQSED